MRKQVKLPPPKKANLKKEEVKEGFVFFVKDQGKGAGKVAVIILKVIELILTTIFALVMGIFAPLSIWYGDIFDAEMAAYPLIGALIMWWLISSIVYIIGLFFVMSGHSKIATVIHVIAAAGTLTTYHFNMQLNMLLFEDTSSSGPIPLYMPSLFITVATIGIMLIINVPKWIEKHTQKVNEVAPSILEDKKKK